VIYPIELSNPEANGSALDNPEAYGSRLRNTHNASISAVQVINKRQQLSFYLIPRTSLPSWVRFISGFTFQTSLWMWNVCLLSG
jgi:hypothetical protein